VAFTKRRNRSICLYMHLRVCIDAGAAVQSCPWVGLDRVTQNRPMDNSAERCVRLVQVSVDEERPAADGQRARGPAGARPR